MPLDDRINARITRLTGPNRIAQRKARLFVGITAIIFANTTLGPLIGHGIAAVLGVAVFLLMLDTGEGK